jgi:hypothetical protein
MGARWYDPLLGRWLSADTIVPAPENPQSLNRYSYVLNRPLVYLDPTGHKEEGACSDSDDDCIDDETYWYVQYCLDNPGAPGCQPTTTPMEAALFFVGGVTGATIASDLVLIGGAAVVEAGGGWLVARTGKAVAEELAESQMTGRPFDSINVGLDVGTEILDEAYTAAKQSSREGTPNPWGSPGNPAHQATVDQLEQMAKDEFGSGVVLLQNRSIWSKTGLNRRPDVSVWRNGQLLKVYEAGRVDQTGNLVPREQVKMYEYYEFGIPYYFGKVGR